MSRSCLASRFLAEAPNDNATALSLSREGDNVGAAGWTSRTASHSAGGDEGRGGPGEGGVMSDIFF